MNVPIGVIQWTEGLSGPELVEAVKRLEKLGYHELWLPEIGGREPFATAQTRKLTGTSRQVGA